MKNARAAAERVGSALAILESISSTGGKGCLFGYRGTEITYEDLRVLIAYAMLQEDEREQ